MSEKARPSKTEEETTFEALEKEFESVLQELLSDESLAKFRREYEKLHVALVNSHESEKRLMDKVKELNSEIASNAEKVGTALRLSREDQSTIATLRKEAEKAWKMVEYLQEKEVWARETIDSMKAEIENLTQLVEQSAGIAEEETKRRENRIGTGGSSAFQEAARAKEVEYEAKIQGLESQIEKMKASAVEAQETENKLKNDLYQAQLDLRNRTLDLQRERARRNKVETELSVNVTEMDHLKTEMANIGKQMEATKLMYINLEQKDKEQQVVIERQNKENENLQTRLQRLQAEVDRQVALVENLQQDNLDLTGELRMKEDKVSKLTDSGKKLSKAKDLLTRKVKALTEMRTQLKKEREDIRQQLLETEKDLEVAKKAAEADAKLRMDMMRERDMANKNYIKQTKLTEKQMNLVQLHEQTNKSMGHEVMGFRHESEKQRRIIAQLEKERDRFIGQNGELMQKVMQNLEDIQMRDMQLLDFNKRCEEYDTRLKVQQNLYEAVHQDRNMYSRVLLETQDEMTELKNKLRMMEHQAHQLKEEVASREAAVVKEHLECLRFEKERDSLVSEVQALKHQAHEASQTIASLRAEGKSLQKVISETDQLCQRQKKELDQLISERDILGSQLVRRNDELSLLYEKTRLQRNLLDKGLAMYDQRIEDMRLLRREVKRQRHHNQCLEKKLANLHDHKQELYKVHREILQERARCAALENELAHPRQIHRWRGLEITDPSKFELLQKVQALQKRLISRTEEVVEVERVLQEKDRLYLELRLLLEKQPGLEIVDQVGQFQRTLRAKNRQMKSLVAELNMHDSESKMHQYDIKKLELQISDMKKKYFKERKRCYDLREIKHMRKTVPNLPKEQFTGGGFKVSSKHQGLI
ncbi:hypothetical protein BaRGS_00035859 [Batillaria attramentaria]|uniref:Cilia- and flagella-associated protein 58 central coiled coil domain-containing protein n=1 Tax=Batillaria attramentaria TaxID=370345 RepID=A0ABD0JDG2_9CAEN